MILLHVLITVVALYLIARIYFHHITTIPPSKNLPYGKKKEEILTNFRNLTENRLPIRLKKNTTNLFRDRAQNVNTLDLTFLDKVIDIDKENKIVQVEGLITFYDLLDYTLQYSLIPLIVPELISITVGGVISGQGLESSSFKYGLIHDMVEEMEILTADGKIVTVSKEQNADLFYAIPNSYGTFGYIISAKIKLMEIKPYVEMQNTTYDSINDFVSAIKLAVKKESGTIDFLDGIILNKEKMILMKGKYTDREPPFLSRYKEKIYYKNLETETDYLTIRDYIWRYDSAAFYAEDKILNISVIRYLFSSLMRSDKLRLIEKKLLANLKKPNKEKIVNDIGLPLQEVAPFLEWYDESVAVYPVWICPYICINQATLFPCDEEIYADFGMGFGVEKRTDKEDKNYYKKLIDKKISELNITKGLYSESFFEEEKFWELYDPNNQYAQLKREYDPENIFGNLHQKVVRNA